MFYSGFVCERRGYSIVGVDYSVKLLYINIIQCNKLNNKVMQKKR